MKPLRVVLDTNVLVSALLFHRGSLSWLRHAWQSEAIRPLASHDNTTELFRVPSYPTLTLMAEEREGLLSDYLPCCETVMVPGKTTIPDSGDRFDRPFLALAVAAKADALITGDKDLLAPTRDFTVPIFTPTSHRKRLPDPAAQ